MRTLVETAPRVRSRFGFKLTSDRRAFLPWLRLDGRMLIALAALAFASAHNVYADLDSPSTGTLYGAQVARMPVDETLLSRQIGRPDHVDTLMRRMLVAIGEWSHYDVAVSLPQVHAMSLSEIQGRLCGGPCAIRAAYVPGEGLYYDAAMQPLTNRFHQSILFHELVHHVQVENGSHFGDDECHRWGKREEEAYALQNRFLFSLGLASHALNPGKICRPV